MFINNYKTLVEAIAASEESKDDVMEVLEFLDSRAQNMAKYITSVMGYQVGTINATAMLHSGRITTEDYQDRITQLDNDRRISHEVALASMDQINRQCDCYGVPHICPDNQDRHVRANFAAAVTAECFMYDHKLSEEDIHQMYELVGSDYTEKNVDRCGELMKGEAKVDVTKTLSEEMYD